jgi:hypothetical protein
VGFLCKNNLKNFTNSLPENIAVSGIDGNGGSMRLTLEGPLLPLPPLSLWEYTVSSLLSC